LRWIYEGITEGTSSKEIEEIFKQIEEDINKYRVEHFGNNEETNIIEKNGELQIEENTKRIFPKIF